jgi:hypothetical protein
MRMYFKSVAKHTRYMKSRQGSENGVLVNDVRLFSTRDSVVASVSPIKVRILVGFSAKSFLAG